MDDTPRTTGVTDVEWLDQKVCELIDTIERLEAEKAELVDALDSAIQYIADWGAYAGNFFQEKHDLLGCITNHQIILAKHKEKKND